MKNVSLLQNIFISINGKIMKIFEMSKCDMNVLWNVELNNELLNNMISRGFKIQLLQLICTSSKLFWHITYLVSSILPFPRVFLVGYLSQVIAEIQLRADNPDFRGAFGCYREWLMRIKLSASCKITIQITKFLINWR